MIAATRRDAVVRHSSVVMRTIAGQWPRGRAIGITRTERTRRMNFALTAPAVATSVANRADAHRLNRMMRRRTDNRDGNTVVHDGAVVAIVIVDNRGLVVNLRDLLLRQTIITRMRFAEIADGHERKTIRGQPETKTHRHISAVIGEADAGLIRGVRRQRRPATIVTARTPRHP